MNLKLGRKVKDRITGFEGIAIAETTYLNGCHQFLIDSGLNKDGEMKDREWVDAVQLKVTGRGVSFDEPVEKPPAGGMRDHPSR